METQGAHVVPCSFQRRGQILSVAGKKRRVAPSNLNYSHLRLYWAGVLIFVWIIGGLRSVL